MSGTSLKRIIGNQTRFPIPCTGCPLCISGNTKHCNARNCVYQATVTCMHCDSTYAGQTTILRKRSENHNWAINACRDSLSALSHHHHSHHPVFEPNFTFKVLTKNAPNVLRKCYESLEIQTGNHVINRQAENSRSVDLF